MNVCVYVPYLGREHHRVYNWPKGRRGLGQGKKVLIYFVIFIDELMVGDALKKGGAGRWEKERERGWWWGYSGVGEVGGLDEKGRGKG